MARSHMTILFGTAMALVGLLTASSNAAVIASYDFDVASAPPPNLVEFDDEAVAANVSHDDIASVGFDTHANGSDGGPHTGNVAKNWAFYARGADDATATDYLEFTVTPDAGFMVIYDELSFFGGAASASPDGNWALSYEYLGSGETFVNAGGSGGDLFAGGYGNTALTLNTVDFSTLQVQHAVTWKLYGFNSALSAQPLKFDDIQLEGTVAVIPEPSSLVLATLGVFCLAFSGWRRR